MILSILIILIALSAITLLGVLAIVDFRTKLLPNRLVLPFFILGLIFHPLTLFYFTDPLDIIFGIALGGGTLLIIRLGAEKIYGPGALGLGDVKLMGAAGAWLGPNFVLQALTLGAVAGLIHGLALGLHKIKSGDKAFKFSTLNIPAGPGFIFGIIMIGILKFWTLPEYLF